MQNHVGFWTLNRQEFYRFWRLIRQTIFPPIITTFLYILIFGFSLGDRIREIHGFSYILYIVPGLVAMGVMNNAFSNTSSSLHMAHFDHSIENILAAPLSPFQIVASFILGGLMRGLTVGIITLAVSLLMLKQPVVRVDITLLFLILQSIIFGAWGILAALFAKTWDSLATQQNFIITPLVYLAGVFYSIEMLPEPWATISLFNPLYYMVDGFRYGVLGVHEVSPWLSIGIGTASAVILVGFCIYLFRIGFRLVR